MSVSSSSPGGRISLQRKFAKQARKLERDLEKDSSSEDDSDSSSSSKTSSAKARRRAKKEKKDEQKTEPAAEDEKPVVSAESTPASPIAAVESERTTSGEGTPAVMVETPLPKTGSSLNPLYFRDQPSRGSPRGRRRGRGRRRY